MQRCVDEVCSKVVWAPFNLVLFTRLVYFTENRVYQPGRRALPWKSLSLEDLSELSQLKELSYGGPPF